MITSFCTIEQCPHSRHWLIYRWLTDDDGRPRLKTRITVSRNLRDARGFLARTADS